MIRNVLVMKSGLVLFSREFANTVQQVSEEACGASNMIAGTLPLRHTAHTPQNIQTHAALV